MIKKRKIIIVVAILVIAISGLVTFKYEMIGKKTSLSKNHSSTKPGANNISKKEKSCYLSKTKSDIVSLEGVETFDIKYLQVTKNENSEVEGILNYLPSETDSVIGNFVGVWKDNHINIIYSSLSKDKEKKEENVRKWLQEKEAKKEQKIFRVYDGLVIEAENIGKKYIGNIHMFENIKNVVFGNNGIFSKIDCADVNKEEVGL